MPRIAGVSLVGVIAAAIAMFFIGFLWYGVLFQGPWMESNGLFWGNEAKTQLQWLTADGIQIQEMAVDPMLMLAGFVLSLVLAFGLGWHMKQRGVTEMGAAALSGLWLGLLIGVPLAAYDTVYAPWHSIAGLLVDGSHTVVGFVVACAVLSLFD